MVETNANEASILSYKVLASRCWKCGKDMTHDRGSFTWTCRCGFDVEDIFIHEFLLTVSHVTFSGGLGLAKHKHSNSYAIIDLDKRGRAPA